MMMMQPCSLGLCTHLDLEDEHARHSPHLCLGRGLCPLLLSNVGQEEGNDGGVLVVDGRVQRIDVDVCLDINI